MPMYLWRCSKCNLQVEIKRTIEECGLEPDVEDSIGEIDDMPRSKFPHMCEDHGLHDWNKLISGGTRVNYSDGWGGRSMKGRW